MLLEIRVSYVMSTEHYHDILVISKVIPVCKFLSASFFVPQSSASNFPCCIISEFPLFYVTGFPLRLLVSGIDFTIFLCNSILSPLSTCPPQLKCLTVSLIDSIIVIVHRSSVMISWLNGKTVAF